MRCQKVNFKDIEVFSTLFLNYIQQDSSISTFMNHPPSVQSMTKIVEEKKINDNKRDILANTLQKQYSNQKVTKAVKLNIESLKDKKTYTITTGHQLNIFSGPLYFVYKILSVINASEILNQLYPEYHFVPVYWMASEDHDLEEISSFSLFGKKYTWDTDQTGPVGRMNPLSIKEILDVIPERVELFSNAYLHHDTLADATRFYVNELFGKYGLVVIDADDVQFKKQIKDLLKDDLLDHHANDLVESASARLSEKGYKTQVYPRAINLFYMSGGLRNRLVKEAGVYKVLDTDLKFTESEILTEVDVNPQKFSPNVILRPLYQEIILPNIAYIGGPAEIAYWLQLKDMFEYFEIPFPILIPRNFVIFINKGLNKKMKKLMVKVEDIFKPVHDLKNKYLEEHSDYTIDLETEKNILFELFDSIRNKSKAVDQSLEGIVESERVKAMKSLENIEKRFKKSEEQKQITELKQIESLKEKLFPGGDLQERTDNYLNFALNNNDFLDNIKKFLDPFDFRFNIIIED